VHALALRRIRDTLHYLSAYGPSPAMTNSARIT
jgi:hypothetical protein